MFKFGSKKDVNIEYKCTVRLLDDNEVLQCEFQNEHKGQYLLDYVCNALNLVEKDYFGLRYVDSHKQRHWLDPTRCILKQIKGMNPIIFCFRAKFYPADPYRLREEITRYQIFLQLRRDLLHGRLYCSQADAALLAAYIIQSELGDYEPEYHVGNYVSEFKLLLKQTPRLEEKIIEIHQTQLRGQVPAVAEMNFLRKACLLDTYGVDPHPIKDHKGNQLYLGINHAGILTFQGSRKTHHFKWQDIQKINYEGKMFIIQLLFNEDSRTKKKHLIGFKCPTQAACLHLWRCAVEQRYFFTMNSSSEVPQVTTGGGLLSRGSKFRYSGRVEKEVVEEMKNIKRDAPYFQRCLTRPSSFRHKGDEYSHTAPTSPQEIGEEFGNLNYVNHSTPMTGTILIEHNDSLTDGSIIPSPTKNSLPPETLETLKEEDRDLAPPDSLPAEVDTFTEPNTPDLSTTHISNHLPEQQNSLEDNLNLPEVEIPEISSNHIPFSARCIDNNIPLDVKIPKRRGPFVVSSNSLPPHVYVMRVIVLASLFVLLILSCLLIVVMESDSTLFSDVRKLPEMIILRREYYEPAKDYIMDRMNMVFKH